MQLSSPAFREGQPIPVLFTCKGRDVSPQLAWSGLPAGTQALALVVDDPDAPRGTWTHWTLWDLPATVQGLPQGVDVAGLGAVQGTTTAGSQGYHGPCPPSGAHRYFFQLYALGGRLGLPPGSSVAELRKALQGRVLAEARLMGTFTKT
jgi:hypothetical protein